MDLPTQDRQPAMTRSGLIAALYGGLSLLALLISAGRGDVDLYRLEAGSWSKHMTNPLIGLAVGLAVVALSRWMVRCFQWARHLHGGFRGLLGHLSGREILILAVASSIGEELLFRGALMPWVGIWPQALLFAGLHIGPGARYLPWTASALAIGVGFGYLTMWTGDLGAAIAAHFVINYLNLGFITSTDLASDDP
jgi:membrane protease YdiL (CAAX protease family)